MTPVVQPEGAVPSNITDHPFKPRGEWYTLCVCGLAEAAHATSTRDGFIWVAPQLLVDAPHPFAFGGVVPRSGPEQTTVQQGTVITPASVDPNEEGPPTTVYLVKPWTFVPDESDAEYVDRDLSNWTSVEARPLKPGEQLCPRCEGRGVKDGTDCDNCVHGILPAADEEDEG